MNLSRIFGSRSNVSASHVDAPAVDATPGTGILKQLRKFLPSRAQESREAAAHDLGQKMKHCGLAGEKVSSLSSQGVPSDTRQYYDLDDLPSTPRLPAPSAPFLELDPSSTVAPSAPVMEDDASALSSASQGPRIPHDERFEAARHNILNWDKPISQVTNLTRAKRALPELYARHGIGPNRRPWETDQPDTSINPAYAQLRDVSHNRSELINSLIKYEGGFSCAENVEEVSHMAEALSDGFRNYLFAQAGTDESSKIVPSESELNGFSQIRDWAAQAMISGSLTPEVCAEALRQMQKQPSFDLSDFRVEVMKIYIAVD